MVKLKHFLGLFWRNVGNFSAIYGQSSEPGGKSMVKRKSHSKTVGLLPENGGLKPAVSW